MALTALQAAKAACEASDWKVSNLALQKLLYLAHMVYAGRTGKQLIGDEAFEAWDYGPVLPTVYKQAKAFGRRPVLNVFHGVDFSKANEDELDTIKEIVQKFGSFSSGKLVEITHHKNSAWSKHYTPGKLGINIPQADITNEYKQRIGK